MERTNVFLSYSPSKSTRPRLIKRLARVVKEHVEANSWTLVDPMTEPGIDGVRSKVQTALDLSHACIAETTVAAPNVMYEVGYCRALGYPVVVLLNESAFDDEKLKHHLEFFGLDPERRTPADLGDVEYLAYPGDAGDEEAWEQFGTALDGVLAKVGELLSPEALLLRDSCQKILKGALHYIDVHPKDHPILRFLGGWHNGLAGAFNEEDPSVFQVSSTYYGLCLSGFSGYGRQSVRAIADLTDDVEDFFGLQLDPLDAWVSERIFLIDWRAFFNRRKLDSLVKRLRAQREKYEVRLAHLRDDDVSMNPFGAQTVSHNLLLMKPDLVGGYFDKAGRRMLRAERDQAQYHASEHAYVHRRGESIAIEEDMDSKSLKRAWLEKHGIGIWDPEWQGVDSRASSYVNFYDLHIRCWVPYYEKAVNHCAALCKQGLVSLMREKAESLSILEIGYGTGALTEPVLAWIETLNKPLTGLRNKGIVDTFVGIDSSDAMAEVAQARLGSQNPIASFEVGSVPDSLPISMSSEQRFDLICGSFVFHDLLAADLDIEQLLKDLKNLLNPGGRMILLDAFWPNDPEKREESLAQWKDWMASEGLEPNEVEQFVEGNRDLFHAPNQDELTKAANAHGFEVAFRKIPGRPRWLPLEVAVLREKSR